MSAAQPGLPATAGQPLPGQPGVPAVPVAVGTHPSRDPVQAAKAKPGKKQRGKQAKDVIPQRLTLQDPELYHACMKECQREEQTPRGNVFQPSNNVTLYLKQNDVRPLKKPSPKFPKANYYCRLCDYHCDNLNICISHIKDIRHTRLTRKQDLETTLYHLPEPTRHHLDELENLLQQIQLDSSLTEPHMLARQAVTAQVSEFISRVIPGASVRLFGSGLSGFGLNDSTLNLDLQIPEDVKPHLALLAVRDALISTNDDQATNIKDDFAQSKIPKIYFLWEKAAPCELSLSNHNAYQTSLLLRDYMQLDPRVKTLATALRLWAKICLLDNQPLGTLSPHTFAVLLVYFLQQETKPVLPCIHDFLESREVDTYKTPTAKLSAWKTRNTKSAAELLIEFFEFFSLGFRTGDYVVSIRNIGGYSKLDKNWKGKKLTVEDPFSLRRSLTKSVSSPANLDYIVDCIKIAYLYFGTVQTRNGPVIMKILVPDRSPDRRGQQAKDGDARNGQGPARDGIGSNELSEESSDEGPDHEATPPAAEQPPVQDILARLNLGGGQIQAAASGAGNLPSLPRDAQTLEMLESSYHKSDEDEDEETDKDESATESFESFLAKNGRELTPKQAKRVTELVPKNMVVFRFDGDILTMGQKPTLFCTVCSNDGHLQTECPEEKLEPLRPLPPLQPNFIVRMNEICEQTMRGRMPDDRELHDRHQLLTSLRTYICSRFEPNSVLNVFGSSSNGFAFAGSDMDISLTFSDHVTDADLNPIDLIERLAQKLKHMPGIRNVDAITSAKVPIIKFRHFNTRIEADISLYNVLAQENTDMLRLYAEIDGRVKMLGYLVKRLAKECDIGDASRGSLSSYAYILMLVHFLQQCNPPVIPVLQELYPGKEKPENMVDGWNAWYYSNREELPRVWPHLNKNQSSPFELWIRFLQYYAQDFDDRNQVVTIRQHKPLSKFEKMWISPTIAIEDPFDLGHNLGAAISRKMHIFIKKTFARTRDRFGMQLPVYPTNYNSLQQYCWDSNFLMDGPPPNDRGCRACGKIGHLVRECPRKVRPDRKDNRRGGPGGPQGTPDRDNRPPRARTLSERANAKPMGSPQYQAGPPQHHGGPPPQYHGGPPPHQGGLRPMPDAMQNKQDPPTLNQLSALFDQVQQQQQLPPRPGMQMPPHLAAVPPMHLVGQQQPPVQNMLPPGLAHLMQQKQQPQPPQLHQQQLHEQLQQQQKFQNHMLQQQEALRRQGLLQNQQQVQTQQQQAPSRMIMRSVEDVERQMLENSNGGQAPVVSPPQFGSSEALRKRQQERVASRGPPPQQPPPGFGPGSPLRQTAQPDDVVHRMLAASAAQAGLLPEMSQIQLDQIHRQQELQADQLQDQLRGARQAQQSSPHVAATAAALPIQPFPGASADGGMLGLTSLQAMVGGLATNPNEAWTLSPGKRLEE